MGLISAWLSCKDARRAAGEYSISPSLLFHPSGDVRHHHNFSFKGYSIGAFSPTEPAEKDTDKLLKQRDRHRDLIDKDNTWSFVLEEYGGGKEITTESQN